MRQATTISVLLALLLAGGAAGATTSSSPATVRQASWEEYHLILERNIFARDRSSPSRNRGSTSLPVPRGGEHQMVLTGAAVRGDLCTAFFEDNRTGETVKASVGRSLGGGTIISVSLDGVEYRIGGTTRKIAIGENLAGVAGTLYSASASSQPASSEAGSTSASEIIERMRQRRLQELRQ